MVWWRKLLNDIMHSDKLAIIIILYCSLKPTALQLLNTIINKILYNTIVIWCTLKYKIDIVQQCITE